MSEQQNTVDLADIRERQVEELQGMLRTKREEKRKARFQQALGQLPKTHVLRQVRRDIARIATVLNSRKPNAGEQA